MLIVPLSRLMEPAASGSPSRLATATLEPEGLVPRGNAAYSIGWVDAIVSSQAAKVTATVSQLGAWPRT
jgi:hypothetical protein